MSQDTSCSRLLILPTELIGSIIAHVSQLCQQSSCNEGRRLRQSCKTLNEAVSLHWPRLTITLDDDCNPCSEEELYSVLRRRKSKLEVVMHYGNQTFCEDGAGGSEEDNGFITYLFEYVPTCAAVQQLSFTSHTDGHAPRHHLSWPSSRTELLCDCFPSLTALSVSGFLLGSGALAGLVDASQQLGLQQLHVRLCAMKEPRRYTRVKAVPLRNVFRGRRLQQLSLDIWWQDVGLPRLQPLARHLTHLTLALPAGYRSAEDCLPLVQGLSQLRVLHLTMSAPLPPLYDSWSQWYNDDADDEAWGEEAGEKEEGEREEGEEAGEQAGEEEAASTDGHMQLAVVEALVAQLQPIVIKDVKVMGLHSVTPSTVWLEMLRCMPATTHLDITGLSSHLGDMEEGLRWLRRQPRRPGGLEISLWAPGTSKTRPRHWRQLTCAATATNAANADAAAAVTAMPITARGYSGPTLDATEYALRRALAGYFIPAFGAESGFKALFAMPAWAALAADREACVARVVELARAQPKRESLWVAYDAAPHDATLVERVMLFGASI
ncbi:hypothetical protein V8C86DRAFT_2444236 [Haematococcus lacustris]